MFVTVVGVVSVIDAAPVIDVAIIVDIASFLDVATIVGVFAVFNIVSKFLFSDHTITIWELRQRICYGMDYNEFLEWTKDTNKNY